MRQWFNPGQGNFIKEGYVVFANSKIPVVKNPFAVEDISTLRDGFFNRQERQQTDKFQDFFAYLQKVYEIQRSKEESYLKMKITQLKNNPVFTDEKLIQALEDAIETKDYTLAFNLQNSTQQKIDKLKAELKATSKGGARKNRSITHTTEYTFAPQFRRLVQDALSESLQWMGTQLFSTRDITIDQLWEQVYEKLSGKVWRSVPTITQTAFSSMQQEFYNEITTIFEANGLKIDNGFLLRKGSILNNSDELKNKKGGSVHLIKKSSKTKTKTRKMNTILQDVFNYAFVGLMGEAKSIAEQVSSNNSNTKIVIPTGMQKRKYEALSGRSFDNKARKQDMIVLETEFGYVDTTALNEWMTNEFQTQGYINYSRFNEELIKTLNLKQNAGVGQIFRVEYNIKTYESQKMNLHIAGSGSFDSRLGFFKPMLNSDTVAQGSQEAFETLVSMLVNTADCSQFSNQVDQVQNYIAAVCVAWMWDDQELLFGAREVLGARFTTIQLFQSGGMIVPASAIMHECLLGLQTSFGDSQPNKLVQVDIEQPSIGLTDYEAVRNTYPATKDSMSQQLQPRWEEMRNLALKRGKMQVSLRQSEIDILLNRFRSVLSS